MRAIRDFESSELRRELTHLRNVPEAAWTIAHSIRRRELERELLKRQNAELSLAEQTRRHAAAVADVELETYAERAARLHFQSRGRRWQ
jgi:hypothetical protein